VGRGDRRHAGSEATGGGSSASSGPSRLRRLPSAPARALGRRAGGSLAPGRSRLPCGTLADASRRRSRASNGRSAATSSTEASSPRAVVVRRSGRAELVDWEPVLNRAGVHVAPHRVATVYLSSRCSLRALEGFRDRAGGSPLDRGSLWAVLRSAREPARHALGDLRALRLAQLLAQLPSAIPPRVERGAARREVACMRRPQRTAKPRRDEDSVAGQERTRRKTRSHHIQSWPVSRSARSEGSRVRCSGSPERRPSGGAGRRRSLGRPTSLRILIPIGALIVTRSALHSARPFRLGSPSPSSG